MLPQYAFLLLAQLVNLGYQCYAMRRLRSLARSEQLLQVRGWGGRALWVCGYLGSCTSQLSSRFWPHALLGSSKQLLQVRGAMGTVIGWLGSYYDISAVAPACGCTAADRTEASRPVPCLAAGANQGLAAHPAGHCVMFSHLPATVLPAAGANQGLAAHPAGHRGHDLRDAVRPLAAARPRAAAHARGHRVPRSDGHGELFGKREVVVC